MEITIKVEGLEGLTEAIALLGSGLAVQRGADPVGMANQFTGVQDKVEKKVEKKKKLEEIKEIADEGAVPKKEVTSKPDKGTPSREDVRALFISKNSPSNRDSLKEILNKYGAENISSLGEEHFVSAIEDLEKLQ